jgi:hypothetical protein
MQAISQSNALGHISDGRLAWDEGMLREKCGEPRKGTPKTVLSRRDYLKGKGKMVIFTMWKHYESDLT